MEERGFVTAKARRLPGPSRDWRETLFRGSTWCPGRDRWGGGSGRVAQASAGQGTHVCPCLCGSFSLPLREYWARCDGPSLSSCRWFGQLRLRYEEALCSLGSPVCTVERQVWSVEP